MADDFGDGISDQKIGDFGTVGIGAAGTGGNIDFKGGDLSDVDFFKVNLTAGITYRITMDGAASGFTLNDPNLILETQGGRVIISDNDSGIGNNSYILF